MENPNKIDDLGVPLFLETPTYRWYIIWLLHTIWLFQNPMFVINICVKNTV